MDDNAENEAEFTLEELDAMLGGCQRSAGSSRLAERWTHACEDELPVAAPAKKAGRPRKVIPQEDVDDIVSLYSSGVSMAAIGRAKGLTTARVKSALVSAGAHNKAGKAHKEPPSRLGGANRVAGAWSAAEPPKPREAKKNLLESRKKERAKPRRASRSKASDGEDVEARQSFEEARDAFEAGVDDDGHVARLLEQAAELHSRGLLSAKAYKALQQDAYGSSNNSGTDGRDARAGRVNGQQEDGPPGSSPHRRYPEATPGRPGVAPRGWENAEPDPGAAPRQLQHDVGASLLDPARRGAGSGYRDSNRGAGEDRLRFLDGGVSPLRASLAGVRR